MRPSLISTPSISVHPGEVVVRVPAAGCLTCGNCTHSEAVADLQLSLG
jgi:hypothetical protein